MKRILSFLFAVMIIFSIYPVNATAAESSLSGYEELINLACDVFPEYALAIQGGNANNSDYSRSSNQIILEETREISETQSLSISMLSNGEVIVLRNNSSGQLDLTVPDSSSTDILTVGVSGCATFEVASSQWHYYFMLSDVKYTIYYTGSDYFMNYGTPYYQALYSISADESNTRIAYSLHVTQQYTQFRTFELYFENDHLIAKVA